MPEEVSRTRPEMLTEPEAALPPLPVRIAQVFGSPARLFDALRARPAWIGALLLLIAINVAMVLLMPEEMLRAMMEAQMPPDADPEGMEGVVRMGRIFSLVGAVLGPPVASAVVAGALLLVYNVILGGEATFKQLFSATVHVMYIAAAGALLGMALAIAKGDPQVTLSLHLLVPGLDPEAYLYRFLKGLNFFSIWAAAVLGLAVSRFYPRRTAGSAAALVVGMYVVLVAAFALLPSPGGA